MDQVFLVNDLNPDLAGWYDRLEADVYLNHSTGWRESDAEAQAARSTTTPATPPAGDPPTGSTSGGFAGDEGE